MPNGQFAFRTAISADNHQMSDDKQAKRTSEADAELEREIRKEASSRSRKRSCEWPVPG